jgi:hypothetical protein
VLTNWATDLRHAWRGLLRTPGFLVTTVVTLGLAIGAVAGMFNVVNTVILKPLPFPRSDQLVVVSGTAPGSDLPPRFGPGTEFYVHYRRTPSWSTASSPSARGPRPCAPRTGSSGIPMAWPTNELYHTMGVRPILGRVPVDADADKVVVISHKLWQTWFSGDSAVLGRSYYISGQMRQIIGVMPARVHLPVGKHAALGGEPHRDQRDPDGTGRRTRDRPSQTRCHPRCAGGRADPAVEAVARPLRRLAELREDHLPALRGRGSAAGPDHRPDHQPVALGAAGRRGPRSHHRVRQRDQPLPGAGRRAPPGPRGPPRHGRLRNAAGPAPDGGGLSWWRWSPACWRWC